MGNEVTLSKVKAASQFNADLCGPVAYYIQAFHEKLPGQDEYILSSLFAGPPIYLEPKSQLTRYVYQTLLKFKKLFPKGVRPDLIARHYAPALAFFKKSIENPSAVLINCRNQGLEFAEAPMLVPLEQKTEREGTLKSRLKRYGYKFNGSVESWMNHRIFFSELRKGNDLVVVIGEVHSDIQGAHDRMRLFDLFLKGKDHVDLQLAMELSPSQMKQSNRQAHKDLAAWKASLGKEVGAADLFKVVGNWKSLQELCRFNNISSAACEDVIVPSVTRDLMIHFMGGYQHIWALDDQSLKDANFQMSSIINMNRIRKEEIIRLVNKRVKIDLMRTDVIARNLLRNMQQKSTKKPRIILLSTGLYHALDIIRYLRKNSKASIIGLTPTHQYRLLDNVAKLPQAE